MRSQQDKQQSPNSPKDSIPKKCYKHRFIRVDLERQKHMEAEDVLGSEGEITREVEIGVCEEVAGAMVEIDLMRVGQTEECMAR